MANDGCGGKVRSLRTIHSLLQAIQSRLNTIQTRLRAIQIALNAIQAPLRTIQMRLQRIQSHLRTIQTRLRRTQRHLRAIQLLRLRRKPFRFPPTLLMRRLCIDYYFSRRQNSTVCHVFFGRR